jgi:hypothetical protein
VPVHEHHRDVISILGKQSRIRFNVHFDELEWKTLLRLENYGLGLFAKAAIGLGIDLHFHDLRLNTHPGHVFLPPGGGWLHNRRRMLGLAGDLGSMPVQDLILYLGNRELTGTLSLECGSLKKAVAVQRGKAINAASNEPREYLGQFLINFGYITEEDLNKGFQVQAETKVLLGRILVMTGAVDEDTLIQVLSIKIRETVLEAFRWTGGSFRFAREVLPPPAEGVNVEVPLLDIHREGEFRDSAWSAMLQAFPAGNLTLQLDETRVPHDLAAESMDARLYQAIREGQTINEMLLTLHATNFQLYQRIYALHRQGMVSPGEALVERTQQVGSEMAADQIIARGREFLAARRVIEAHALAERAVELTNSREARDLLDKTEMMLSQQLREAFFSARRVPYLTIEPARLRAMELSPPERYLLSRIDGVRDVKTIVRVSPVREIEALKSFQRFVDSGIVRMA